MAPRARITTTPVKTFAVYEIRLLATQDCVHSDPYDVYVGSTHEASGHPASARIREHRDGYKSKIARSGYRVGKSKVVCSGLPSREAAEEEEGRQAAGLRALGFKVWCDR